MTAQAELELVEKAISDILGGRMQSYSHNSGNATHQVQYLSLNELYKRKNQLEQKIAIEKGGLGCRVGIGW